MLSIIKLFAFFVFFVILCESVGLKLLNKINIDINIIALPIGMMLFGCLYEILIIPVAFFQLDSSLLKYALILLIFFAFLYGKKEIKSIIKHISKKDAILLLIFIVIFVAESFNLKIYGNDYLTGDDLFYIPFINGISMDGIAVNGPFSNLCINMLNDAGHAFEGQLYFIGAISNLLNVDALITLNFFQKWYIIAFYITNIYNVCIVCINYKLLLNINKYLAIVFIGALCFIPASDFNSICVRTTCMAFIMTPLILYIKEKHKGWLILFGIYSFYAVSIRSTFILLILLLMIPYFFYQLINNKLTPKENIYVFFPAIISAILFYSFRKEYSVLLVCILVTVVFMYISTYIIEKIGLVKIRFIYFAILIGLFLVFVFMSIPLGNIRATWDNINIYDLLNNYFYTITFRSAIINGLYNSSFLFFNIVLLIYNLYKKRPISYWTIHAIIIYILFLNKLVAPFINSLLYDIYDRLFWLWINPLLYILTLNEFIDVFKNINIKKIFSILLSIILLVNFSCIYIFDFISFSKNSISNFIEEKENVSFYYKVGKNSFNIGTILSKYANENNYDFVKVAMPISIVNSALVSNKIKLSSIMGDYYSIQYFMYNDYFSQKYNEDNYKYPIYFYLLEPYRFFDDWHLENDFDKVPNLELMLKESNTDIFVIKKWDNREETFFRLKEYLESFSYQLYENEMYQVYVLK